MAKKEWKPFTKKQLARFRREWKIRRARAKKLSKKYGYEIAFLDLNPKFTATQRAQRFYDAGYNFPRKKRIEIDYRITKRLQHRVIKHEIEHIKKPRASEKKIEGITKKKYGWIGFEKVKKRS